LQQSREKQKKTVDHGGASFSNRARNGNRPEGEPWCVPASSIINSFCAVDFHPQLDRNLQS
jgi:hypothetical protein